MSMEVDFTTPLTEEERKYLHMRGRLADVERADNTHGVDGPEQFGDGSGPQEMPLLTGERAAQRREELLRELALLDDAEPDEDGDEDEVPPYESWKVADLDAELRRRSLATDGNKEAKAQRLYADDEANQQQ